MGALVLAAALEALVSIARADVQPTPAATPAVSAPATGADPWWSLHGQTTVLPQGHGPFPSAYQGQNSLYAGGDLQTSFTATAFLGARLWSGSAVYFNPEVSGGSGLSGTHGVAGYPNGEIYRVDSPEPKPNLSKLYLRQDIALGVSHTERVESDKNQVPGERPISRLTVIFGKFSLGDYFDDNSYSHDPRTQFFNWALMDEAAWDYAADTRGYTWALYLELNQEVWAVRLCSALVPAVANGLDFDMNIRQARGDNAEFELRYHLREKLGKARILAWMNHANMGLYQAVNTNPVYNNDITQTRAYRIKWGLGVNLEQAVSQDLGVFLRAGWNDGATETWAFTEVDESLSLGVAFKGRAWRRESDTVGAALIANGLSQDHLTYLSNGGSGFLLGDGRLSYAPEEIFELYYLFHASSFFSVSADYQFVNHPGYNQDRGPVSIFSARLHFEI